MDTSIIISGFGGQGVLFAGSLLCHAAVIEGKETTWIPSYGAEMRGGAANCSVHISDDEVSSPIVNMSDVVFALNLPAEQKFEHRVKPGGLFLINTSLIKIKPQRTDIAYLNIPLNDIAAEHPQPVLINVMAVGAFVERTKILKIESVQQAIEEITPEKRRYLLPANLKSFDYGVQYVRQMCENKSAVC